MGLKSAMDETSNSINPELSIVIADDHRLVAEAMKLSLKADFSCFIDICHDLPNLIDFLENTSADIILLGLRMPGMMGIENIAKVVSAAGEGFVILFTGQIDQRILDRALELGVKGLIHKSLPLKSLASVIDLVRSGQVFVPVNYQNTNKPTSNNSLNDRELSVLRLTAEGFTNKEIAREMQNTEITIKMHMRSICKKLGARNRAHAAIISHEKMLL
jgi:two-component system nitrate/nitrite response regulator NarP